jgi:primosomal protein N'
MYLFSFKQFAWHDRVFLSSLSIWKAGDLIQCGWDFLLNLWDEISFPELIKTQFTPTSPCEVVYPKFFDEKYLSLLHWMVYQRYSTYNNVLKYFVSFEISQLLARESKIKWQTKKLNLSNISVPLNESKQNLIIIPDNRSRENQLSSFFSQDSVMHLYSTDTQNRKDQNRRNIKKSKVWVVVATQSEVFQPFSNLWTIVLVDGYKWYYHNQQDPRYDISEVVKKMKELRGCDIISLENESLIK